jgi:hypothetical protein
MTIAHDPICVGVESNDTDCVQIPDRIPDTTLVLSNKLARSANQRGADKSFHRPSLIPPQALLMSS